MSGIQRSSLQILNLDQVLNTSPLKVAANTSVTSVVELMSQSIGHRCSLDSLAESAATMVYGNYVLVMSDQQLIGIFTERDLVRLVAEDIDLSLVKISAVMTQPVKTLAYSEASRIFAVLAALKQHRIRQLPIVDEVGNLLGVVSQTSIRQALKPFNLLKLRYVGDVMSRSVITARGYEPLFSLVQRMAEHRVSCIVITEPNQQDAPQEIPLGIVTERDILQFRALGLPLRQTIAQGVMSTPLSLSREKDSLWMAHQQMQRYHTHRLVVTDANGDLAGIVSQTDLLQPLDPIEMLEEIEQIQHANDQKTTLLSQTNLQLQTEIEQRQRLEMELKVANRLLEESLGRQTARLVQTDTVLQQEIQNRYQLQVRLGRLFELTPNLLCIAGLDGYFQQINPRFFELLGYDETELISTPFINFVHPDDRDATQAEVERLVAGERSIAFENRYRCKDGNYRWLEWNAIVDAETQLIYAAARDVSDRKQTVQALKHERDFTAAVLNTVGALIIVLDKSGKIVRFNRSCEQVSGYDASEVIGQEVWTILTTPEEQDEIRSIFQDLKLDYAANQYENEWICKDGSRRLIRWSNTALSNAVGAVDYLIGTGIDITEQRRTEEALARQYQQRHLFGEITRKILASLEIDEILRTVTAGAQQLLNCDRVLIVKCVSPTTGIVIQESSLPNATSFLNQVVPTLNLNIDSLDDIDTAQLCHPPPSSSDCSCHPSQFLGQLFGTHASIESIIYVDNKIWGIIAAVEAEQSALEKPFEINLMQQLAEQMGVALSQAQLLEELEIRVEQRTNQLVVANQHLEREIQERIHTETALRDSQQQLAGILDTADDAIISIDKQQRIILYNQGARQIFGYTPDEVLGQPLDMLMPAAFHQSHRRYVDNFEHSSDTSRQMAERSRDVSGQRKTGEIFPAEASISRLSTETETIFTVILKDITERRQAEMALRRSEEQLRLITDALPVLICYVDGEQRYRFTNQTYEAWFQCSVEQLLGHRIQDVTGKVDYQQMQPYIEAALEGERVTCEVVMTPPDGRQRDVVVTYIPDIGDDHTIKGVFGLISDISDRKLTERLKDEFVSVAGHELRTPLTSIHGSLKLISTSKLGQLSAKGQEIVDIALKNTERLTRLINDVLDLERIESGRISMDMESCNLAELVEQATQAMQAMADEQGVQLLTAVLDTPIWADADHIIQLLTNLLSNAIKFSPAGSAVRLSIVDSDIQTKIAVKDEGRGIPSDKLDIIFERFQQVDASDSRRRGGTGLGLTICQKIVQQHGGKIWAESVFGKGSTFYVTLPKRNELYTAIESI
ncbi:PAS domain S-box protein [Leptolyngbya cf. ectocarpi LEGE 11479]|uniref:histidine kinase n=1 Tax=Leptolyngbya cf. ectocarpi LEGE 11479 TaxID=1828722 RepID=A0A928X4A9_LEPEC|nr:PAS domain S-box protein [Leptolyngbya ectocarpi]MBE9066873.1 PAS domain S-box protein [Leptolyngbya cf. ectocarpi LEGE 11479]